ncbi:hypothetical protein [Vibrio sp. CUB2]|uniref:hypothetical protein n=1 Tax=Vibrio sp. CUB2 TaxID=2315233 RepID=UPI00076A6E05|nr:hypothetical protein [Vibrio sp. CUB2]
MKNQLIGLAAIIAILLAIIWRWESANDSLKDVLFYSLLAFFLLQNLWFTFKSGKSSKGSDL